MSSNTARKATATSKAPAKVTAKDSVTAIGQAYGKRSATVAVVAAINGLPVQRSLSESQRVTLQKFLSATDATATARRRAFLSLLMDEPKYAKGNHGWSKSGVSKFLTAATILRKVTDDNNPVASEYDVCIALDLSEVKGGAKRWEDTDAAIVRDRLDSLMPSVVVAEDGTLSIPRDVTTEAANKWFAPVVTTPTDATDSEGDEGDEPEDNGQAAADKNGSAWERADRAVSVLRDVWASLTPGERDTLAETLAALPTE